MGKNLEILRKLIKEELEIALNEAETEEVVEETTEIVAEEAMEDVVDYLLSEEYEELDEAALTERGRKAGSGKVFTLKGGQSIEDVKRFLKGVQSLIATKKGRGRKGMNFTDADIDAFAELLTRPEGFTRKDILSTISFYTNLGNEVP